MTMITAMEINIQNIHAWIGQKRFVPRVLTDPPCKRDGIVAAFAAAEIANPEINEITISGVVDKRNKNCFMFYIYYLVSTFKKEAVFIS